MGSSRAPGIKIAVPGPLGSSNSVGYAVGTSVSAALVTNRACQLYEVLMEVNKVEQKEYKIPEEYFAVLIKALLVHYAEAQEVSKKLQAILIDGGNDNIKINKEYIIQNLGYGVINKTKLGYCTNNRVTLIGFGKLKKDQAHIYRFPLPTGLSGKIADKKLTITLAWLSPVNFQSGKYKMAQLYVDNIKTNQSDLTLDRSGNDFHITKRGTVQHDVLENDFANVYVDGSELIVKISCREQASGLKTRDHVYETEYGLAVSLEVKEESGILIYDEIKTRVDAIKVQISQGIRVGL